MVIDGVLSRVRGNSGVSLLIIDNMKNKTNHSLIKCHCLLYQDSLCVKSLKVTLVSELLNFMRSEGMNQIS
jgi:hypothetical protein